MVGVSLHGSYGYTIFVVSFFHSFIHSFIFRKSLQDMEMVISIIIQGEKRKQQQRIYIKFVKKL